jgi:choline dehydrogenase-like flavoprotein
MVASVIPGPPDTEETAIHVPLDALTARRANDAASTSPALADATPSPARGARRRGGLTPREHAIVARIAEAAVPAGDFLPGGGADTADAVDRYCREVPMAASRGLRSALWTLELSTMATRLRPLSSLPLDDRMKVLESWGSHRLYTARMLLRAVMTAIKYEHFSRAEMFEHVGCSFETPPVVEERPRWLAQVVDGREVDEDLELECEVVVVGTGAGGAAAAYELAKRGRAVLMLEEGDYHRRQSFRRPQRAHRTLYRDQGLLMSLGNIGIPIWAGRAVGGSTVINSGTCYRAPERTLRSWRERERLPGVFSSTGLDPYYAQVEAMLGVEPAPEMHLGVIADIIARGADQLGLSHHALMRNAPGCDGQGVCCFGCPTGAKRSTDVSYVPEALKRGAQLVTAARVSRVDIVAGRARGVTATLRTASGPRKLTVKADAVVVAGGTLLTPLLLKDSGACRGGALGKNLSIHPASKVMALFDDDVDQFRGIPQSYTIDHYADEGLLFEGGSLPLDVAAVGVPWTGRRFTEVMERYRKLATFGFMIKDESRGEVRRGPAGKPLILYNLSKRDTQLMKRGVDILCEVYQAAGAKRVLPLVAGHDEVNDRRALDRFRRAHIRPGDLEVTAFHPLGTCRVGTDPKRSCLTPDHEAHDVAALYVCDGSAVPSSLGVNPQMTIMAMALRAAEGIDARLG